MLPSSLFLWSLSFSLSFQLLNFLYLFLVTYFSMPLLAKYLVWRKSRYVRTSEANTIFCLFSCALCMWILWQQLWLLLVILALSPSIITKNATCKRNLLIVKFYCFLIRLIYLYLRKHSKFNNYVIIQCNATFWIYVFISIMCQIIT